MNYPIQVTDIKRYKAALTVVNCFLELSDYEMDVIVGMLNKDIKVLNTKNRRELRDHLDTNVHTFNNYIKKLKDRGYLIEAKGGLELHSRIIDAANDTDISITIICQQD